MKCKYCGSETVEIKTGGNFNNEYDAYKFNAYACLQCGRVTVV